MAFPGTIHPDTGTAVDLGPFETLPNDWAVDGPAKADRVDQSSTLAANFGSATLTPYGTLKGIWLDLQRPSMECLRRIISPLTDK